MVTDRGLCYDCLQALDPECNFSRNVCRQRGVGSHRISEVSGDGKIRVSLRSFGRHITEERRRTLPPRPSG